MSYEIINQRFVTSVELLISGGKESSIASLMKNIGRTPNTYSEIKGNRMKLQLDIIQKFCSTYNVSLDYIFNGVEPVFKKEDYKNTLADNTTVIGEPQLSYKTSGDIHMPHVITVDSQGNDNIVFVPIKARAGYLTGFGDPEFIGSLPTYHFPGVHNGTYRMFEVEGLSMHPTLSTADIVISEWVGNFKDIRDERVYVVVTEEGMVIKRVINRLSSEGVLILKSDNIKAKDDYPLIILQAHEIREVWYCRRKVSADFSAPTDLYNRMTNIEAEIYLLKEQLRRDKQG